MGTIRRGTVSAGLAVSLGIAAFGAASAQADEPEDFTCTSGKFTGTVHDVTVPKGSTCVLKEVTVTGSISLAEGGNRLELRRTTVAGGISTVNWNTNVSAATITATSSTVTGDVVVDNTTATYSDTHLGSLKTGGFMGDDTTLAAVTVDRNFVSGGRYTTFTMSKSKVKGDLSGGYGPTHITSSTVKGKTTLSGLGLTLCGSTFGSTTLSGEIFAGDNAKCAGNKFKKDLTIGSYGTVHKFYNNVVTGSATSPDTQSTPIEGANNTFNGGVTGILATVK